MSLTRAFSQIVITRSAADDTAFQRSREVSPDTTDYETITSRAGARDALRLRRTMPSNTSSVTAAKKGELKLTRDISYTGPDGRVTVLPRLASIGYSLPVVATDAQVTELISDIRALADEPDLLESMFKLQAI